MNPEVDFYRIDTADTLWLKACAAGETPELTSERLSDKGVMIIRRLADATLAENPSEIMEVIIDDEDFLNACADEPVVKRILPLALGVGVRVEDADTLCYVGALYYSGGHGVEQDYTKAADFYERSSKRGSSQGSVNLGYCYYYGRHQEKDYAKAFACFTLGYSLDGNAEAAWKLGDMFDAGLFVEKNEWAAFNLYQKAYLATQGGHACARPAHHLADMYLHGVEGKVEPDPKRALKLYVEAEIAYYGEIDSGLIYYEKNLRQAIESQKIAREMIEHEREGFR